MGAFSKQEGEKTIEWSVSAKTHVMGKYYIQLINIQHLKNVVGYTKGEHGNNG